MSEIAVANLRRDGGTQPRVALDLVTVAEYAEALEAGAVFPPVTVFADSSNLWLADGFHRVAAAERAGFESVKANIKEGTRRDAVLHAVGANADHGLRRTNEDKRHAVWLLLEDDEWGRWSNSEIARRCRVSHTFVNRLRDSLETVSSDDDGRRTYTDKHGNESTMDTSRIGRVDVDPAPPPESPPLWTPPSPAPSPPPRHDPALGRHPEEEDGPLSHEPEYDSDEWYTPARFIEAAHDVLGGIDLDPASCEVANQTVKSASIFTKEDDGLSKEWFGRVWLNPPYSQPAASLFADKLIAEYKAGRVTAAIMVQNASTDTGWFHRLAEETSICLVKGRINFDRADGRSGQNRYGQCFFFFGDDEGLFEDRFRDFGLCGRLFS